MNYPNLKPQRERFESKKEYFDKIINELVLTLNSRAEPYSDSNELAQHFCTDSGLSPLEIALDFGFPSFLEFLKSPGVSKYYSLSVDLNAKLLFKPLEDEKFKHIRDNQSISYNHAEIKANKKEQEKLARAMLPENQANILEGKRRIIDILVELNGETKPISFQEVQNAYLQKFDVPLAGTELKRLFQRTTASKIFLTLFHNEIELHSSDQCNGMMFLKLRHSREKLYQLFDSYLEGQKKFQELKGQNYSHLQDRRRRGSKKVPIDSTSLKPILPRLTTLFDDEEDEFNALMEATGNNEYWMQQNFSTSQADLTGLPQNGCMSSSKFNNIEDNERRILRSLSSDESDIDELETKNFVNGPNNNDTTGQWYIVGNNCVEENSRKKSVPLSPSDISVLSSVESTSLRFTDANHIPAAKKLATESPRCNLTSGAFTTFERPTASFLAMRNDGAVSCSTRFPISSNAYLPSRQITPRRTHGLAFFISNLIFYRSPDATDIQLLLDIVEKLDPDYEMVLGELSIIEFIQKYCNEVAYLVINNSIVFGWHSSNAIPVE